jgi:GDP-4-dehydro-6-deoxy-D-mannose reductase
MRVLITGASGFVAPHLVADLREADVDELWLTAKYEVDHPQLGRIDSLDITDRSAVSEAVYRWQPDCIVHLAGIASPSDARRDPTVAWSVHLQGSLNIANSILEHIPQCSLLFAGTGMVYGGSARHGIVDERTLLDPIDEYAASKAAADLALGALAYRGLRSIRLRPFNHTGPGQSESFVAPGFSMQIARIEAGLQPPVIRVGNLDAIRDVLDVRDVTRAYAKAVLRAHEFAPGTILNIASGSGVRMADILDRLLALSGKEIRIEQDSGRVRLSDIPKIVGDSSLAHQMLDWTPERSLNTTLADVLDDCRERLRDRR